MDPYISGPAFCNPQSFLGSVDILRTPEPSQKCTLQSFVAKSFFVCFWEVGTHMPILSLECLAWHTVQIRVLIAYKRYYKYAELRLQQSIDDYMTFLAFCCLCWFMCGVIQLDAATMAVLLPMREKIAGRPHWG